MPLPAVRSGFVRVVAPIVLVLAAPERSYAQDTLSYRRALPPPSRIIGQSEASATFDLYDGRQASGVNPRLHGRLLALAERFAPLLHFQNQSVPRAIGDALDEGPYGAALVVDDWFVPSSGDERYERRTIDVAEALGGTTSRNSIPLSQDRCEATSPSGGAASALARLVSCRGPFSGRASPLQPAGESDEILYFDFLGTSSGAWRREYLETDRTLRKHVYVHPFVARESLGAPVPTDGEYRFVLQYWFFYPFNDFVNNHEGDWEHVNVHVTTRRSVEQQGPRAGLLTRSEVENEVLAGALDDLVVGRIDYYFHHNVMVLDLVELGVYTDPAVSRASDRAQVRLGTGWESLAGELRRRHGAQARAPTHPVGFVAGSTLSWTLLVSNPGTRDRNSHGNYPFPGIWKRVGPALVHEIVKHGDPSECTFEAVVTERCSDAGWKTFQADDITILPDWDVFFERCAPGLVGRCSLRSAGLPWFWLYLPIRWGYPVSSSPGGGLVPRYNVGQASPMGPAFQSGWNRDGAVPGFPLYRPHVRGAGLMALTDVYEPGWGWLNTPLLSLATIAPLPLLPAAIFQGERAPWTFTPQAQAPERAFSLLYGPAWSVDRDQLDELVAPGGQPIGTDGPWVGSFALRYHLGRWASGVAFDRDRIQIEYVDSIRHATIDGVGGFVRLTPSHGGFQPFLHFGYGWSRLRIEGPDGSKASGWLDTWPNDWQMGIGAEAVRLSLPRAGLFSGGPGGWDIGIEVQYVLQWSSFADFENLDLGPDPGRIRRGRLRLAATLGR